MGRRHVPVRHAGDLPVLRTRLRLALQPGRCRTDRPAPVRPGRRRSSRRAGSTTSSTARSSCSTRGTSDGATPAGQAQLQAFYDSFPNSPVCNIQKGTTQGPVIARFDQMSSDFSAIVWGRVLPIVDARYERDPGLLRRPGARRPTRSSSARPVASPSASSSASPAQVRPRARPPARQHRPARPSASPSAEPSASPS